MPAGTISLAPTAHWSSSGRARGDGAVMTGLTGAPSGRSGGAVCGGGDGEGSERLARLRVGAWEGDASRGGA
eukprot:5790677-Pleurochrysis_carterae.AAC.1